MTGHLYEKYRALQAVYDLMLQENVAMTAEISRLSQQEQISKGNLGRERELRKTAEREKSQALDMRAEVEEQLQLREAEVQQLQLLLRQAAAEAQQGEIFLGYGNGNTAFRQSGRVGV